MQHLPSSRLLRTAALVASSGTANRAAAVDFSRDAGCWVVSEPRGSVALTTLYEATFASSAGHLTPAGTWQQTCAVHTLHY